MTATAMALPRQWSNQKITLRAAQKQIRHGHQHDAAHDHQLWRMVVEKAAEPGRDAGADNGGPGKAQGDLQAAAVGQGFRQRRQENAAGIGKEAGAEKAEQHADGDDHPTVEETVGPLDVVLPPAVETSILASTHGRFRNSTGVVG